jgi:hypothetical protein
MTIPDCCAVPKRAAVLILFVCAATKRGEQLPGKGRGSMGEAGSGGKQIGRYS